MTKTTPQWGQESRFYLPNEDAQMIRTSLAYVQKKPLNPVFVGGSGMVLLDALAVLNNMEQATFVDISEFQVSYFSFLLQAIKSCSTPEELQTWFSRAVYPELFNHFSDGRNHQYSLEQVLGALQKLFHVRFFFEQQIFDTVKAAVSRIQCHKKDIVSYLAGTTDCHDFIYLSNVPDYLPEEHWPVLFAACARQSAPVYLLMTETCPQPLLLRQAWEEAGYSRHPVSTELTDQNCGLGAFNLQRSWNRKGRIELLVPETRHICTQ